MLIKNIFDISIVISSKYIAMIFGAILADKGTKPNNEMGCQIVFSINAVFIVWRTNFFLEESF
jgi:hypothetical protein